MSDGHRPGGVCPGTDLGGVSGHKFSTHCMRQVAQVSSMENTGARESKAAACRLWRQQDLKDKQKERRLGSRQVWGHSVALIPGTPFS